IDALSQFCIGLASRRPTVLILEDWHWRDEASEQVLRRLAEMVADRPLAIVATARPEYDFSWASSIEPSQLIVLSPLDFHDSEAIMRSVLKADALPARLSACIFEQTIGNPLFLEEICHAFLEEGVVVVEQRTAFLTRPVMELLLPESVQSIIRSRLDRLDWHVKEVLRVASVIGRVFTVHLLERVCEGQGASRLRESLDTLTRFDMLLPVEGHQRTEYMFKHVLTQEVTYSTVLLQRRKALHGVVGQAIEDLYHHRIHEVVDLLLHHYSLAEDWAKAAHYARESAERARRLSRFEEALEFLERRKFAISKLVIGRDAHGMLVETLLEEERLCDTLGWRARQEAVIEQLFSVLQYYREPTAVTAALLRQGDLQTQLGQYGKADAALTECLAMRGAMNDRSGESHALRSRSFLRWHQAKLEEAVADNEAAFRIDEARGDYRAMSHDLTNLAPVLQQLGDFDGALKRLEHALALEARERDPFNRMTILFNIANLHNKAGDFSTALAYYRDSLAVCVEHHLRINQTLVLNCMASIYWKEGRSADCLALYEEAVAICRDMKYGRGLSNVLMAIGNVFLLLDRAAEALPYFLECTTLLAELGDKVTEALSWNMAAHIYEQTGQHRQAFEAWKHARSLRAERMDQRGELDAVEAMGKLARDCFHEPMQALRLFQEGLDLAISLQDFRKEGDLFNAMAVAHWGQGVFDEALRHYEAARDRYSQAGALPEMTLMVNSVGMTLHKLRRDEEAMTQLEEALALAQKAEHRLFEGYALASLGDVCLDRRDMRQARLFYERSYEIRRQIGDRRGEGWMLHQLGLTESIDGNHDAARERIEEALSIAKAGHDTELVDTCTRAFEALVD
ncbi:MAG TPA: tetratricopeptide repeat protein, partial [Nitrospira sp.]|nr:tetratricopeptide repeat protein [Nitrospira sp.]